MWWIVAALGVAALLGIAFMLCAGAERAARARRGGDR